MKKLKQKGQVIIEFAVVLPLFLLLLFGIIYSGMLFYDYISLSNLARSSAREAAISTTTLSTGQRYTAIENDYKTMQDSLITRLYTKADDPFIIKQVDNNGIEVTITMNLNTSSPLMEMVLPESYEIRFFMRKDQSG